MAKLLLTSTHRRLAEMTAIQAGRLERAAERTVDRDTEREAAMAYEHMIGADRPMAERRERALSRIPQTHDC